MHKGPGAYIEQTNESQPVSRMDVKPNNIFVTKVGFIAFIKLNFKQVPRFCPTAPGSTIFKYPSSIYNPGPGTYYKGFKWDDVGDLTRTKQAYDANKHNDLVIKP